MAEATAVAASTSSQEPATLADIFPSAINNPVTNEYLHRLTSLPLQELLTEPPSLATHAHHLTSSLTNLTHASYPTFIALHNTTSALNSSLDALSNSLSTLLSSSLPALETSTSNFKSRTEPVLAQRSKARGVLEQHDKIRDLLDAPLLIDTCVRNGYFAEALSLAAHVSAAAASGADLAILRDVRMEVDQSVRAMLGMLLATLREPGRKLPALWKAVTFIRRMGVLEEDELALAFVTGRGECLSKALEALTRESFVGGVLGAGVSNDEREREDVARYLRRYIDAWREGVYDIITQYTAIFLEDRQTHSNPPSSPLKSAAASKTAVSTVPLRALLSTYTSHTLHTHLLPTLTTLLPQVPAAYASLLTQLTYCATAFARVGMDFRGLLGGLFSDAVAKGVENELRDAGKSWDQRIQSVKGNSATKGKTVPPVSPSQWLFAGAHTDSPPTSPPPSGSPAHVAPLVLASYPPLAEFTNALLTTFNGLRLLAPVSILGQLVDVLDTVLAQTSEAFLAYATEYQQAADESAANTERELKILRAAGEVFSRVLVPFARRALVEGVYGLRIDSAVNGRSSTDAAEKSPYALPEESELNRVLRDWEGWLQEDDGDGDDETSEPAS
ncbi:hypothetical protein PLICRDRAFT_36573 [Plicaturopsis crispa FD-325 SS-3]|nr:hypothetical protein PLICRDRAFT_36573 [Plicaturopsis crispa FD-325 SS-3]